MSTRDDAIVPLTPAVPQVLRAIGEMLLACLAFAFMNACAKALAGALPATEVAFFRVLVTTLLLIPIMHVRRVRMIGKHQRLLFLRSVTGTVALCLNFAAAAVLPLAELGAIVKSSVLFTVLLGMFLLGEERSGRRVWYTTIGFLGVGLVLRPTFEIEPMGAMQAIGTALFSSVSALAIRELGGREHPLTVVFHFSLFCCLVMAIGFSSWFIIPSGAQCWLLLGCGLAGTFGQIFVTAALQRAPASVIAPYAYSEVLFAVTLGVFLFSEVLSVFTLLGAGMIVGSGMVLARLSGPSAGGKVVFRSKTKGRVP